MIGKAAEIDPSQERVLASAANGAAMTAETLGKINSKTIRKLKIEDTLRAIQNLEENADAALVQIAKVDPNTRAWVRAELGDEWLAHFGEENKELAEGAMGKIYDDIAGTQAGGKALTEDEVMDAVRAKGDEILRECNPADAAKYFGAAK